MIYLHIKASKYVFRYFEIKMKALVLLIAYNQFFAENIRDG